MKSQYFLVLSLFAVVFVAGCIQAPAFLAQFAGTTKMMTKGLSVTDFSAMPTEQFAGRNVRLSLTLENTGGNTTGNILACISGENFPGLTQGSYKQGFWELSPFTDNVCKKTRGLNPPDPNQQIPGGTTNVKWTVTAPIIPEGMSLTDTFTARLFYEYSTKASLSLTAIAEAERIAMAQRGESVPTFKVEKTEGPIEIDMDIAPQPVILIDSEAFANLKITLTNTGGGALFDTKDFKFTDSREMRTVKEDKMNRLVLGLVYPKDKMTIVCGEQQPKKDQYQIELFKEKYIVSCDIRIKDSTLTTKKSYPIFVFANYGYYQDASVGVRVTSRPGMPVIGIPAEEKVEYYSFDTYDALDVSGLLADELNLTYTEMYNYRKPIEKHTSITEEVIINEEKAMSDEAVKTIDFTIVKNPDYNYQNINFQSRPKINGVLMMSEECSGMTNEDSIKLCEESTGKGKTAFINPAHQITDRAKLEIGNIKIRTSPIFDAKSTNSEIGIGSSQGYRNSIILKIFSKKFKQGEKIDMPIALEFKASKTENGETTETQKMTRILTLHLKQADYSKDFTIRKSSGIAEAIVAKDENNYRGTCSIRFIDFVKQSNQCIPKLKIECNGGFVDLGSGADKNEKPWGFYKTDSTYSNTAQFFFGVITQKQSIGYREMKTENMFPKICSSEKIYIDVEPSSENSCDPDENGLCDTDKACNDYDYKYKLSLNIPDC